MAKNAMEVKMLSKATCMILFNYLLNTAFSLVYYPVNQPEYIIM